ncbi:MAG: agmatine deiminase family protein [Daejeonella sp.]|uniref:agmatine deiminase family protein n=1 Tax=Daejeonella sp. TaxID=2805397 RepID=UPI002735A9B2|nr:agmatine deiminase family protein [Daejeonella sp.]MDP3469114.1 agmatine deiminase family protein [Daejeonella sp.]
MRPIIVDRNLHDAIGHTDGYMAFNNQKSIFISRYPHKTSTITDIEYTQHLIYSAVRADLDVIPIYDLPSIKKGYCGCEKAKPCFYSAEGTFINFLRLNDTIILPEYSNCKSQGKDLNVVNENILIGCGFKVLRINCDLLATFGGSLHCISWQA